MALRKVLSRRRGNGVSTDILVRLAEDAAASASRLEDRFWETRLNQLISQALTTGHETTLQNALDQLAERENPATQDLLAGSIEACVESTQLTDQHTQFDILLISLPVMASSSWPIPAGGIEPETMRNLAVQLGAHVLAQDCRVALADCLFSPDQLPAGFSATADLRNALAEAALAGQNLAIDIDSLPEAQRFIADTRHILGVVAAPAGRPVFRWQEADGQREEALKQWRKQAGNVLARLLVGCQFELCLPGAYHATLRETDRRIRAFSVGGTVAFLAQELATPANELQAAIAICGEGDAVELRIGFTLRGQPQVLHGIVWPLFEGEQNLPSNHQQIESLLRTAGLGQIVHIDGTLPAEICDDCGAPFYPNQQGELMHAEMPENPSPASQQLH